LDFLKVAQLVRLMVVQMVASLELMKVVVMAALLVEP
jgi:hypothetical protein